MGVEGGRSPILTFPPRGKGYPATLPLWIPAFEGMTSGGVRERRETETPPRRAPALGSRFRENDGGGVRAELGYPLVGSAKLAVLDQGWAWPPAKWTTLQ